MSYSNGGFVLARNSNTTADCVPLYTFSFRCGRFTNTFDLMAVSVYPIPTHRIRYSSFHGLLNEWCALASSISSAVRSYAGESDALHVELLVSSLALDGRVVGLRERHGLLCWIGCMVRTGKGVFRL